MTDGPVSVPTEGELAADLAAQADRDAAQDAASTAALGAQVARDSGQDDALARLNARVTAVEAALAALPAPAPPPPPVGGALDVTAIGYLVPDQFSGTDAERLAKAVSAIGAITTNKPILKLPTRTIDMSASSSLPPLPGLEIEGPRRGSEFNIDIKCPPAGLFTGPVGKGRLSIRRVSFWGNVMPLLRTGGQDGVWADLEMDSIGIRAGRLLSGAFTRARIDNLYGNAASEPIINAYFTDSFLFPSYCTLSGTTKAGVPILRIAASNTVMGAPYVTPQGGAGIEIFYSMGGFVIRGARADSWKRSLSGAAPALGVAPQSAGWKIHGTVGLSLYDIWTNNVNASGIDPGDIVVGPDNTDLAFFRPTFVKTYDGQTSIHSGPAIYTEAAIKVYDPIALGGYPKGFVTHGAGKVTCNDPSWTTTAA